jgi:hypothetical protein
MCAPPRSILLARKERSGPWTPPRPRPRRQLRGLTPLGRVLAQLDALLLGCRPLYPGYTSRCPVHLGDKHNFEVVELDRPRQRRDRTILPAGTVLVRCQAYGDAPGPDGCSQERVIEALGLLWSDLYPDGEEPRATRASASTAIAGVGRSSRGPVPDDEVEDWTYRSERFRDEAAYKQLPMRLVHLAQQLVGDAGQLEDAMYEALVAFEVGWSPRDVRTVDDTTVRGQCWTLPERDGRDRIVGINRRYPSGEKRCMAGSRRGLYVPRGWREMPGPVYCPEGLSDAAIVVASGGCAIGRPGVTGGTEELAELLRGETRPVVVLGENDGRPLTRGGEPLVVDGEPVVRTPGRDGAVATATRLRAALPACEISMQMPPDGFKDIRDYLTRGARR